MFIIYIKVKTVAEMNAFNQIWMDCWLEKGYMLEPVAEISDRFIILNDSNKKVGTIEFKPYFPTTDNNINTVFPFHRIEFIEKNPMKVVEVDKASILKQHRGKNLERLISLCINYTQSNQIDYCVVLLERLFYKALKNVYKIPLEAVGDQIYYKGDYVIPTILFPSKLDGELKKKYKLDNIVAKAEKSTSYVIS
ncbi:hypothetical protein [Bacillus sp. AK128]